MSTSAAFFGEAVDLGETVLFDMPRDFQSDARHLMGDEKLLSAAKQMGEGSLLLAYGEFAGVDPRELQASFVINDQLGLGREESGHQIYFGQMLLKSATDYERPELVAMKPHVDIDHAIHELAMNVHMNRTGGRWAHAFQPLGIWRDGNGDYTFITRYEHAVTTFDTILWADKEVDPKALDPEYIKKALRLGMYGIGSVNGRGFAQVDSQAKNEGSDSLMVRFIDLEEARVFPDEGTDGSSAVDETRELVDRDIETFVESCFRNPDNTDEIGEALFDTVEPMARSYRKAVNRSHGRVSKFPRRARPTIRDLQAAIIATANKAVEANWETDSAKSD